MGLNYIVFIGQKEKSQSVFNQKETPICHLLAKKPDPLMYTLYILIIEIIRLFFLYQIILIFVFLLLVLLLTDIQLIS